MKFVLEGWNRESGDDKDVVVEAGPDEGYVAFEDFGWSIDIADLKLLLAFVNELIPEEEE